MPEQSYAARLRERAERVRKIATPRHPPEVERLLPSVAVGLSADEADAVAGALELLAEIGEGDFREESWYDEETVPMTVVELVDYSWEKRIATALDALNRRAGEAGREAP